MSTLLMDSVYSVEYNVSYVYHDMYAYLDRDNIALKGLANCIKKAQFKCKMVLTRKGVDRIDRMFGRSVTDLGRRFPEVGNVTRNAIERYRTDLNMLNYSVTGYWAMMEYANAVRRGVSFIEKARKRINDPRLTIDLKLMNEQDISLAKIHALVNPKPNPPPEESLTENHMKLARMLQPKSFPDTSRCSIKKARYKCKRKSIQKSLKRLDREFADLESRVPETNNPTGNTLDRYRRELNELYYLVTESWAEMECSLMLRRTESFMQDIIQETDFERLTADLQLAEAQRISLAYLNTLVPY